MDIEFLFIKGTPPRNVLDIREVWPSQQITANYTQIQNDVYYAPIDFPYNESAKGLKLRSGITGHGQEGEFIPRDHTYTVNSKNYTRTVWKECASNPVYPQGGTWIYDRAGWCPGMATDVAEYDLTEHLNNDNKINIDYNVNAGSGDSRYIISSQVVTYGDYNFNVDAEIIDIKEPSNKVEYARENPMCISPRMLVKNTGKDLLTSIEIDYWVNDKANKRTFTWPCYLRSDEVEEIYFPIDNGIWSTAQSTNNQFFAELVNVNGAPDEYTANNTFVSGFDLPEVYPQHIYFFYRTNSFATENTISVKDEWGTVLYERNNLTANTLYRDTLFLGLGCKTLEITDNDGDGISFWANNDGSGFFRIMEVGGSQLKNIEPDFGNGTKINFTVAHTLDVPKLSKGPSYKLYPNPTTGIFTLSGGDLADSYVRVYNAMGQQIESMTTLNAADISFDLSSEPAGVYFVSVAKNGSTWTQKVIIR